MLAGQQKQEGSEICLCVEESDADSFGVRGILRSPYSPLSAGHLQVHRASHPMGGRRADFKKFLGEQWAVNTSTGNSALLSGNVLSLELKFFYINSLPTFLHISLEM